MEVLAILRVLWRRRLLAGVGALAAVAAALTAGAGGATTGGFAKTSAMLDTTRSQLVNPAPRGAESLPWRASLLAQRLGTRSIKERIAREARIPVRQLTVVDTELTVPTVAASLPRTAEEGAAVVHEPYLLTVSTDGVLPVISIEATAPDRDGAARLTEAAVGGLEAGAAEDAERGIEFSVEHVGPIEARATRSGGGELMAVGAAAALLIAWCAAVALFPTGTTRKIAARRAVESA